MDVLLIRPYELGTVNTRLPASLNKAQGVFPPLGLAYIAAVLEKHQFKVRILDLQAIPLAQNELKRIITLEKPLLVGISCMTTTLHSAYSVAQTAKHCGSLVALGGPHLAAYPKEVVSHKFVDFGLIGEAEYIMLDLVNALKNRRSYKKIKGLVYESNGNIHVNGYRIVENLDELPFPARHLLPMEKYDCIITDKPFTTMITSRGCPYNCSFCFKQPSDKKYRKRSVQNVISEIKQCISQFKVREIMFYDDTFTTDRNFVSRLCGEIIRQGIKVSWEAPTRVNTIDYTLLKLMKQAGCIRLRFGVESGNPRILKLMKKGIRTEQIKEAFKLTRKNNIQSYAYFMIGYPTENEKTMKQTIKFAKELNPDWVMFTAVTPLPCTELFDMAVEQKLVDADYWAEYTLGKQKERIPYFVKNSDRWIRKAYRGFYFRPGFVMNKIFSINNIDTLRKYLRGIKSIIFFSMNKKYK